MKILVFTDPHFTDNPLDIYRFSFMSWLKTYISYNSIKTVYCLGDLTEKKDKHNAILVNEVHKSVSEIAKIVDTFVILKGNHDYIDEESPFFEFLQDIPSVRYISEPTTIGKHLFLPHTKDIEKAGWGDFDYPSFDRVFIHQCITGAKTSLNHELSGIPSNFFTSRKAKKVYGGDIHTPQIINGVEYIGTPYPIYFENSYSGRVLIINGDKDYYDDVPSINRFKVKINNASDLNNYLLKEEDQIKVELVLTQAEAFDYVALKKGVTDACNKLGVVLCGVDLKVVKEDEKQLKESVRKTEEHPSIIVKRFASLENLDKETLAVGLNLIGETE